MCYISLIIIKCFSMVYQPGHLAYFARLMTVRPSLGLPPLDVTKCRIDYLIATKTCAGHDVFPRARGTYAASEIIFLAPDWLETGPKNSLRSAVSCVTRICDKVLQDCRSEEYSVARKMSWLASRPTTRLENAAYCLMDLFGVGMSLSYGDGIKAFPRLQQAIMQKTEDQSIFARSYPYDVHSHTFVSGMMAPSTQYF